MGAKIKKPAKRFEPITQQQNRKLHAVINQNIISEKHMYELVEELIGLPSIVNAVYIAVLNVLWYIHLKEVDYAKTYRNQKC